VSGTPAVRLDSLLEALASKEPAPASGSAAAAVLAAAAALLEKCASVSTTHMPDAASVHAKAHALRLHAEELIEQDTYAYLEFVVAQRSAKELTGNELADALQPSAARTVEVPLDIVRSSAEVAELADQLAARGNPKLRADAVISAMLCSAVADAGTVLIGVNVGVKPGSSSRDGRLAEAKRIARSLRTRARRLASQAP